MQNYVELKSLDNSRTSVNIYESANFFSYTKKCKNTSLLKVCALFLLRYQYFAFKCIRRYLKLYGFLPLHNQYVSRAIIGAQSTTVKHDDDIWG